MKIILEQFQKSFYRRKWLLLLIGIIIVLVLFFVCQNNSQPSQISQSQPRDASKIKPPSVKSFPGPVIPGLRQSAIPQGMAYIPRQDQILISHYFENAPAFISVLNAATGKMLSAVKLQNPSGQFYSGHVGGIAVWDDSLFVASDGYVLRYELAPFLSGKPPTSIRASAIHKSETTASFCTATDNLLFVGEFAYGNRYPTDRSHHLTDRSGKLNDAWVCGYDKTDPLGKPKCVLSIRQKVQGMAISGDRIFLSISYGRANRSLIAIYRNPMSEPSHQMIKMKNGETLPLWFLDDINILGEIDYPPMSEGIVMIDNRLAVLSESGASKYQLGGKGSLDRILFLDVSSFK